jgi:CMP-N-acetylneuraminic acid synthetase
VTTFAFTFARGGSKGLPGKNTRVLAGKPLIAYAIEGAKAVGQIKEIYVSTDSDEIATVATDCGAKVINRPAALAQDDSPEWLAWQHAVRHVLDTYGTFDTFVSLPATAPLRTPQDIKDCLAGLDNQTDMVLTMSPAHRSPWFNMVKADKNGYLSTLVTTEKPPTRRQDVPQGFDLTTLAYVARPEFILTHQNMWQGRVKGVLIPPERAIDIDTEFDFKIAEFLMRE